jgi:hypothetical protein
MSDYFDFALSETKKTGFDVRTLGGLKQYVPAFKARHTEKAARQKTRAAKEKIEAERRAYEAYRSAEIRRILQTLPAELRTNLVAEADRKASSFSGSLREFTAQGRILELVVERHGAALKTFDQWKADTSRGV